MARSRFYNEIVNASIERQVEDVYNKGLGIYFNNSHISYPFSCDGYLETKTDNGKDLRLLVEFKYDKNFESSMDRAKVILQSICYIKKFELEGREMPNVILIGDKNECFILHTNDVIKYLDYDIDWNIAASSAADKYVDVCVEISNDEDVRNAFVYSVDGEFSFKVVADKIKDFADNVKRYVHITEDNIVSIFDTFSKKVLSKSNTISANDLVGLFVGVISNNTNYYMHPNKKNTLVTPYGEIKIKSDGYKSFIDNFSRQYTPIEKRKFTEISDRLIEDTNRRNKGEFYTPKLFVDYAHDMITKHLGADWKENYVVWDNCCGTKNLTKDYNFNELYCSTLENAELEMSAKYNTNSTSFQFDFLNDSLDKLPKGLLKAFEQNKPIVFLINPPYATAASKMGADGSSKDKVAKTMINEQMLNNKIGSASQNLYAQFLYRILMIKNEYNLSNLHIALFSPTLYLSGTSWKGFRNTFLNNFKYNDGCVFKASHFADCADSWGISFSLWGNGVSVNKNDFIHTLIDIENDKIIEIGEKDIYNVDFSETASDWAKKDIKGLKTFDEPNLSSGIKLRADNSDTRGTNFKDNLGYFLNAGNNVDMNMQKVTLFTSAYGNGHGHGLSKDNFHKCTALFTARKLIEKTWINSKDEYLAPNEEHPQWKQFVADSVVYSLFHSASNQSSLRKITYKGKQWDIKNEFFFMSREQMLQLANENNNDDLYNDCSVSDDRFVYKWLEEHKEELSDKAKEVLEMAKELVISSMKYRTLFNEEHEEYQINNFDCGYYQLKALWKQYMPNELKEFQKLYKEFSEQLKPMVYELGFLKK